MTVENFKCSNWEASVISLKKKSQHGCGRWAPQLHLTPPCSDFACGGLEDSLCRPNKLSFVQS